MSETSQAGQADTETVPSQTRGQVREAPDQRAAVPAGPFEGPVGGAVFASTLLMVVGAFQIIVGLTALLNSDFYAVTESGLVVNVDYTAWGWVHLALGAIALAAGLGLLSGQMWARMVGIAMASISAIVNLAFIPAYPLWALLVIAVDVVVIYAIAVHGGALKAR